MKPLRTVVALVVAGVLAGAAGPILTAQMTGHQHGAMQGSASTSPAADQMMRRIDSTMSGVSSGLRSLTSLPPGSLGPQHDQMLSAWRGVVDQMHQVHAALGAMAKDSSLAGSSEAMRSFEQAGAEFQRMGADAQAVMRNLGQTAKSLPRARK